VENISVVDFYW